MLSLRSVERMGAIRAVGKGVLTTFLYVIEIVYT